MHRRAPFITFILCALLCTAPLLHAAEPVSLKVYPTFGFEPLTVQLTIRIPQHPDNRAICIFIEDVDQSLYYRSSCREHGATGPTVIIERSVGRDLRAAYSEESRMNYVAWVILSRVDAQGKIHTFRAQQLFRVIPSIP